MIPADAVAGHSLGEYSALYAAGVLHFEDALSLVQLRGQLMAEAGEQQRGSMVAVLGLEDAAVEELCNRLSQKPDGGVLVAANYNAPGQVVVSGSAELVREAVEAFHTAGALKVVELAVSGAFHSPLMSSAQERLAEAILATPFRPPRVPVYCNVSGKPCREVEPLRQALIAQLTSPVQWKQTLHHMYADDVREFVELGPGKVLQGLVRRTLQGVVVYGVDTTDDVRHILKQA
ncbi:MAG: ACP S-malonyltransferase [Bacteroidota bacterium]|nr:ACP S-malonyltransferase [Bacteroidota bacterium]